MLTGTKEYCDSITKNHQCPEHGIKLTTVWNAEANSYAIKCAEGHFPEEVTERLSPTAEFKQGLRESVGKGLDLLPRADLATGEVLLPSMVYLLVHYAHKYGLDAYRGHVALMHGKPYIGIDGYLYHANKQKTPYRMVSRPLDDGERKAMMLGERDHGWKCEIDVLSAGGYFIGLGIVTQGEMTTLSKKDKTKLAAPVVAAHPWLLAQKRAEWQALRRAFPIGETEEEVTKQ